MIRNVVVLKVPFSTVWKSAELLVLHGWIGTMLKTYARKSTKAIRAGHS